jgi:KDO2-lipid IV(A) lauroyltransferase
VGKQPPHWTHPILYGAVRAMAGVINVAGVERAAGVAREMGRGFARLPANSKRVERARANIRWVYPELPPEGVDALAEQAYMHLFTLAVEVCCLTRLATPDGWPGRVRVGHVDEALRLLTAGGPVVLITGHCGNWEMLGFFLGALGVRFHALYRPLDLPPLDAWVRRSREMRGLRLLDKFGAIRTAPALLARGEAVSFTADQNAGDRGLFVPFFDRLASAYKSIGLLAMQHSAPIICGHTIREGGPDERGFAYRVDVADIIRPEDWADHADPLFYITARYRRAIETMVQRAPEQYLWMHRAWKSRPRFETLGRPMPPSLRDKIASLPWMTEGRVARIVERSARDASGLGAMT